MNRESHYERQAELAERRDDDERAERMLRLVRPQPTLSPCLPGGSLRFMMRAERVDMLIAWLAPKVNCRSYPWGYEFGATTRCESTDILERLAVLHGFNRALLGATHSCKGE